VTHAATPQIRNFFVYTWLPSRLSHEPGAVDSGVLADERKENVAKPLLEFVTSSRKALNSASSPAPDGHLQHPKWSKISSFHSPNLHKSCRSCNCHTRVTEINNFKECPASSTLLGTPYRHDLHHSKWELDYQHRTIAHRRRSLVKSSAQKPHANVPLQHVMLYLILKQQTRSYSPKSPSLTFKSHSRNNQS
jgi:hypothetical protein